MEFKKNGKRKAGVLLAIFLLAIVTTAAQAQTPTITSTGHAKTPQATTDDAVVIIQNITGNRRGTISAILHNNGTIAANDLFIKMIVTGGLLGMVNKSQAWGLITLAGNGTASFYITKVHGLGKITITVVARALNLPDITKTVNATIIGCNIKIR